MISLPSSGSFLGLLSPLAGDRLPPLAPFFFNFLVSDSFAPLFRPGDDAICNARPGLFAFAALVGVVKPPLPLETGVSSLAVSFTMVVCRRSGVSVLGYVSSVSGIIFGFCRHSLTREEEIHLQTMSIFNHQ